MPTPRWYNNPWLHGFVLIIIFLIGLKLRLVSLPDNLLFGFEQGRDAIIAHDIITLKKLTLIGPKTDIDGIFHGAFYYYLIALFYLVAHGDPAKVSFLLCFLNGLTIFVIYAIGRELYTRKYMALGAALLAAVSFNIIIYGRWLSNVSPSMVAVALFFYTIIKLIKTRRTIWLVPAAGFLGLLAHFEILHMLYGSITLAIVVYALKLRLRDGYVALAALTFLVMISPFIIFDLRHQFILTKGLVHYGGAQSLSQKPLAVMTSYLEGLIDDVVTALYPKNAMVVVLLLVGGIYMAFKRQLDRHYKIPLSTILMLLFWTLPYVFLLKYSPLSQFYAGTAVIAVVLAGYLLDIMAGSVNGYVLALIVAVICYGNITYARTALANRENIFYHATQQDYRYHDQLAVMDYMFKTAPEPFAYDAFTIPYYHKEAWDYLYSWYGPSRFPGGYQRNDVPGDKNILFMIIEPSTSGMWLQKWLVEHDAQWQFISKKKFGPIEVQMRRRLLK